MKRAELAFVLANRFLSRCRLAVLLCAPGHAAAKIEVRAIEQTTSCDFHPGDEGWGWATLEFTPRFHLPTPVAVSIAFPGPPDDGAKAGLPTVAGFIVYPIDEDRHWFELLDRASRGRVDEIRAIRSYVRSVTHPNVHPAPLQPA